MTATITVKQTDTGWYVVVVNGENVVVKTDGPRITVAATPDDDDADALKVSLGPPEQ